MTGSTYTPQCWADVEASKIKQATFGTTFSAVASSTTTVDVKINDDSLVRGIELLTSSPSFTDTLTVSIVDVDGVYQPAGTVMLVPITNYNIPQNSAPPYFSAAPSKILGGLYFRFAYTNTSPSNAVPVAINLILDQVLI